MNLKEKIKSLPASPGVYLMKDSGNSTIYVGKSKNLKNRVSSYFINSRSHSPKVVKLVANIRDFEYILTDTEFEAFILECKLIRKIKPIYNKKMKNPLSYTYIKIDKDYTNIEIVNNAVKNDGNTYFGPYTSKRTVEKALNGIKEYYKIMCSGNYKKASPCLNYSLGSCIGYCFDAFAKEDYKNILYKIIDILNGTSNEILVEMEHSMNTAAESFNFEVAARYRDYISFINSLINREKVIDFAENNIYILSLEYLDDSSFKFFLISGSKVIFSEKYTISKSNTENLKLTLKNNILYHFNNENLSNVVKIGKNEIDEAQIIYSYLKMKQNNCRYAVISEKSILQNNTLYINEVLNILF